jgi:hypothetical protein
MIKPRTVLIICITTEHNTNDTTNKPRNQCKQNTKNDDVTYPVFIIRYPKIHC